MNVPSSTTFREWMEHLTSPRGPEAEWPWLLRELLILEYHRLRNVGFGYAGDVFKDRDDDEFNKAVLPEKRAVKELFHRCRTEAGGLFRIGDDAYWLLGYEWPNQGSDRGRRADLVGLNTRGGLVVFECKLANNPYGPFAAIIEGLDYLSCLTSEHNSSKIREGFNRWVGKPTSTIPVEFRDVVPTESARNEVVVLAPDEYFGLYTRSARGSGWKSFAALADSTPSLGIRFAVSDFSSTAGIWVTG